MKMSGFESGDFYISYRGPTPEEQKRRSQCTHCYYWMPGSKYCDYAGMTGKLCREIVTGPDGLKHVRPWAPGEICAHFKRGRRPRQHKPCDIPFLPRQRIRKKKAEKDALQAGT